MVDDPSAAAGALDRGLALLVALLDDGGARPLPEIAAELALPASTARRIVAALEARGLVMRIARGRFAKGPALGRPGRAESRELLAQAARPTLRALSRTLSLTAHLGVLDDQMVTYVAKEHGRTRPIFTREEQQLEAYCSAVGKVLLAALPADEREAYVAGDAFVALTANTITSAAGLRAELATVAERGHAIDDEEVAAGLYCLGVPVPVPAGEPGVALSVSGPKPRFARFDRDALLVQLRHGAAAIARRRYAGGK